MFLFLFFLLYLLLTKPKCTSMYIDLILYSSLYIYVDMTMANKYDWLIDWIQKLNSSVANLKNGLRILDFLL